MSIGLLMFLQSQRYDRALASDSSTEIHITNETSLSKFSSTGASKILNNGDSQNNIFQLTQRGKGTGSIVLNDKIDFTHDFDIDVEAWYGIDCNNPQTSSHGCGDGIGFIFSPEYKYATDTGGSIGFGSNTKNGFGFSTAGAESANGIYTPTLKFKHTDSSGTTTDATYKDISKWVHGNSYNNFKIDYDAESENLSATFTNLDGTKVEVVQDITQLLTNAGTSDLTFQITGTIGAAYAQYQVLVNEMNYYGVQHLMPKM